MSVNDSQDRTKPADGAGRVGARPGGTTCEGSGANAKRSAGGSFSAAVARRRLRTVVKAGKGAASEEALLQDADGRVQHQHARCVDASAWQPSQRGRQLPGKHAKRRNDAFVQSDGAPRGRSEPRARLRS